MQQKNKAFVPGGYFHVIQESAVERDTVLINRLFNRILQIHRSVSHALKTSSVSRLHSVSSARSEMHSQPRCVWIPRTTTSTVDKCQRARPKIKEPASVSVCSLCIGGHRLNEAGLNYPSKLKEHIWAVPTTSC